MSSSNSPSTPEGKSPPCNIQDCLRDLAAQLICDASYVVKNLSRGEIPGEGAKKVSKEDIVTINRVSEMAEQDPKNIPLAIVNELEAALRNILSALAPVTVPSLRDTDTEIKRRSPWSVFDTYEAKHLSNGLVAWTIFFTALAMLGEFMERYYGEPLDQAAGLTNAVGIMLQNLVPFTYGAIGACVFLLRALHMYIYERTFDRRRRPEYINRVLLGAVSGGTIVLLINQLTTDDGSVIELSEATLGFITGYNTDLLFQAIERISQAILPRVGLETVQRRRDTAEPATPLGVAALLDRLASAKSPEERAFLERLIEKAQDQ